MVFADSKDIAYALAGTIPRRKNKVIGQVISEGWQDENEWMGYLNPEEKPHIINPASGFVFSANNLICSKNVKHRMGQEVVSTGRSYRLN